MQITLHRTAPSEVASFGVPFAPGIVTRTGQIRLGDLTPAITPTLFWYDADGQATSLKAVRIQVPMAGDTLALELTTDGTGPNWLMADAPFSEVSHAVSHQVPVADYTIVQSAAGAYSFAAENLRDLALFETREPCVVVTFPDGYLASTGVFGPLLSRQAVVADPTLAGVRYLSDSFGPAVRSALFLDEWPTNANAVTLPLPVEGYLYDRAATLALAYAHTNDPLYLRPAYRYAWAYQAGIVLEGSVGGPGYGLRGYWSGKGSWDSKYSHARGLFAYYALTGDEGALEALKAIGDLWAGDLYFSKPYQTGKIRGRDKLWTERLLGTALEGCFYGFAATGEPRYLDAFEKLLVTAYRHITTQDQAELDAIMQPWVEVLADGTSVVHRFPPQNAFVHNAGQASEGSMRDPWCSGWMIELLLDPLLAYQAQTNDPRVDEILVRLGRFLRDTGTCYLDRGVKDDSFLAPSTVYDPALPASLRRKVIPMYGSGRRMDGTRWNNAEYSDYEHVPDTTALTAAAWRGLARQGSVGGPIGPFATEQACADALHQEYSASAVQSLVVRDAWIYHDPRQPSGTFHTSNRIAASVTGGPETYAAYIAKYGVGYPRWAISPQRKLSWWFNSSILQFGLLKDAGLAVPSAGAGFVQPGEQPPPPPVNNPPTADAGGPYTGIVNEEIVFVGVGSDPEGSALLFEWAFGDGAVAQGQTASHIYPQPGPYTATLKVTDPGGLSDRDTAEVSVTDPAPTYEELLAENAALTAQVESLEAQHQSDLAAIAGLAGQVNALEATIAQAITILEA